MKSGFLDKLIQRIRHLQPEDVQAYLRELAREKGFLETIFDSIQEGIIVTNLDGDVLYLNKSACDMFGLQAEKVLGRPLSEQVRGLSWEEVLESSGTITREMEVFYPKSMFLNFYVTPLMNDAESRSVGRAIILRDVSESRRATQETIESERFSALTMLAAGVAHEIGNPLNSLSIHLSVAERRLKKLSTPKQEEILESLRIAKEEVARLDHIITQFLRAIRPTSLKIQRENLNHLVEESITFFGPEIENREVLVELKLSPTLPLLPLDREQIRQAFYNIIRNSLQAIKSKGILSITTGTDEEYAWVNFTDTGGGIPQAQMNRLFDPYFTTKQEGNGLGLLVVRRIVRAHGGDVIMESAEGKGLSFIIRLPRIDRKVRLLPSPADVESEQKEE